jgi:hypothetical protein
MMYARDDFDFEQHPNLAGIIYQMAIDLSHSLHRPEYRKT